jgi:hypothetical protein
MSQPGKLAKIAHHSIGGSRAPCGKLIALFIAGSSQTGIRICALSSPPEFQYL